MAFVYQVKTFSDTALADLEKKVNNFLNGGVREGKLVDIKYSFDNTGGYKNYTAMIIYFGEVN